MCLFSQHYKVWLCIICVIKLMFSKLTDVHVRWYAKTVNDLCLQKGIQKLIVLV